MVDTYHEILKCLLKMILWRIFCVFKVKDEDRELHVWQDFICEYLPVLKKRKGNSREREGVRPAWGRDTETRNPQMEERCRVASFCRRETSAE